MNTSYKNPDVFFRLIDLTLDADRELLKIVHREIDSENGLFHTDEELGNLFDFLAQHNDIFPIFLEYHEGDLVGFARLQIRASTSSCERVLMIDALHIMEHHRGKGFGDALLREIITFAQKHNIPRTDLLVSIDNIPAIKLYEKHGFKGRKRIQMFRFNSKDEKLETVFKQKRKNESDIEN
jgi:ribosomal protein S18 acetylase RimI-like enzyme